MSGDKPIWEVINDANAAAAAEAARTGGAAFPRALVPGQDNGEPGMTLRDWFAGQALAGLMADPGTFDTPHKRLAESCYGMADAMLAARAKPPA
jgi:hypothetical protein